MTKMINNADDFGYSQGVNYGIIDAFLDGVLTSTTIMAGMPGFDHAIFLAKQNPTLGIGIHLTLTCGYPLINTHKTLVQANGTFSKLSFYENDDNEVSLEEVYREWHAQIEKVMESGIKPTHLDAHHHIHTYQNLMQVMHRLAKEYDLPIRNSFQDPNMHRKIGISCNDELINPWGDDEAMVMKSTDKESLFVSKLIAQLQEKKDLDVIEVMWHPAYLDSDIMEGSGWVLPRLCENKAIKNEQLKDFMKKNFTLVTYNEI